MQFQFTFLWHLLKGRPDVLISSKAGGVEGMLYVLLCRMLGIRLLWFAGGVLYRHPDHIRAMELRSRMERWFGQRNPWRWVVRQADGMVVYSAHAREYYASRGISRDRIFVAPNSMDTDLLAEISEELASDPKPVDYLRKRYTPNGEKCILMIGRLNKGRMVDSLFKACTRVQQQMPDVSVVLIGDGPAREELQRRASEMNLRNVHFPGAIYDDRELATYLILCDVYVCIASLTIKMAMAMGRPVVCIAYGLEMHDIEEGHNGFLVEPEDIEALSERILRLLRNDGLRRQIGIRAEETIRTQLNINQMIKGFQAALNSLHTGQRVGEESVP